jgi:hypothetical protein
MNPIENVVEVEPKLASTVFAFDDSESVNVDVVPPKRIKVGFGPR